MKDGLGASSSSPAADVIPPTRLDHFPGLACHAIHALAVLVGREVLTVAHGGLEHGPSDGKRPATADHVMPFLLILPLHEPDDYLAPCRVSHQGYVRTVVGCEQESTELVDLLGVLI